MYEYNGADWIQTAEIKNNQTGFAGGVAIENKRIAINSSYGYCSIYDLKSKQWVKTAEFSVTGGNHTEYNYYATVSLSGNFIAFSSRKTLDDNNHFLFGIFKFDGKNTWNERSVIENPFNYYAKLSGKSLALPGKLYQLDFFTNGEDSKIVAPYGNPLAEFGAAVGTTGEFAVMGAPHDDDNGIDAGAAYLYVKNGNNWDLLTKLYAPDGATGDQFGSSAIALERNNFVIVGAPFDDDHGESSGSVYIFQKDYPVHWKFITKITAPDGMAGDQFGSAISMNHNKIVVGAPYRAFKERKKSGAVYIFNWNREWKYEKLIYPSDPKKGDLFGSSVDLATIGETLNYRILVGAPLNDDQTFDAGAAYIFDNTDQGKWRQKAKIFTTNGGRSDRFGSSLSLYKNIALIGSPLQSDQGDQAGAAYIFSLKNSSWTQDAKLTPSDVAPKDRFGGSVVLDNNKAIVGSSYADHQGGTNAGAVYLFNTENGQWVENGKLISHAGTGDQLGYSVATNGNQILAGAYHDDQPGLKDAGAAFIFNIYNLEDLPTTTSLAARTIKQEELVKTETVESLKNPLPGIREMSVYPNPFIERFTIALDKEFEDGIEVTVVDQLGRTLYKNSLSTTQGPQVLDVDVNEIKQLQSGVVFVGLKNNKGERKWFRMLKE